MELEKTLQQSSLLEENRQKSGIDKLLELASAKQSRVRILPRTTAHTRPPRTHACTHREAHEKKDKKEKKKGNQEREKEPTRETPTPNTYIVGSENTQKPKRRREKRTEKRLSEK